MGKDREPRDLGDLRNEIWQGQKALIADIFIIGSAILAINYLPEAVGTGHPYVALLKILGLPVVLAGGYFMGVTRFPELNRLSGQIRRLEKSSQRTATLQRSPNS